jgi:hypothetical protein
MTNNRERDEVEDRVRRGGEVAEKVGKFVLGEGMYSL